MATETPNRSPAYADAIAALYPVAYALKFTSKLDLDRDCVVPPLEGLWWADDMAVLQRMHHEFIPEHGMRMTGRHHEICCSDFRKVSREKLRTHLRQPVTVGPERLELPTSTV